MEVEPSESGKDSSQKLYNAIKNDKWDVVAKLIGDGATLDNLKSHKEFLESKLFNGVISRNWKVVELLIGLGAVFKNRLSAQISIQQAADNQAWKIVNLIVEKCLDKLGEEPIVVDMAAFCAAQAEQWDVVKLFMGNIARFKVPDDIKERVLLLALEAGQWDVVKLLIDNEADVNAGANFDQFQQDRLKAAQFSSPKRSNLQYIYDLFCTIISLLLLWPLWKTLFYPRKDIYNKNPSFNLMLMTNITRDRHYDIKNDQNNKKCSK